MTLRGYMKRINGSLRMRFVMPGYDADDENVPPNKVIFDSDNIGTLSILLSGVYSWNGESPTDQWVPIATWSALSFVPLCYFVSRQAAYPASEARTQNFLPLHPTAGQAIVSLTNNMIRVKKNGIDLKYRGSQPGTTHIYWYAFNLRAA
ncbi:hypothetical protein HNR59_001212 [Aquamicrobium lusatiense]|uniref:Uncharacterized protein n=1 Tax=Aquamicrobium lusatiense TaxID=89772 RepID=A0A7W9VVB1_9HYPH|nr:hypothetical protein [Aquamicrobium lusatiense]MBB6011867.1 hypothetical protein [Aquamicrobium lusatiense]